MSNAHGWIHGGSVHAMSRGERLEERRKRGEKSIVERERERETEEKQRKRDEMWRARIEQPVSIARGLSFSSSFSSSCSRTLLLLLLLLLLAGLRLAADHSYQHNYKLGSRLSVSLTSLHPSRRNTRSLSRPGETFVVVVVSSSSSSSSLSSSFSVFAFLLTVDCSYLASVADSTDPQKTLYRVLGECLRRAIDNCSRAI